MDQYNKAFEEVNNQFIAQFSNYDNQLSRL